MNWKTSLIIVLSIFLWGEVSAQQNLNVQGIVTSADDSAPLPGVTVTVKGTTIGTTTGNGGKYALSAPKGSTLVFSFIGMTTEERNVNATQIDVALEAGVEISDVVVVGYGTVKKTDLTGAVGVMTTKDLLRSTPTSINQSLQGKLAGVAVAQNDGAPGAGVSILVRGANSFSNSEPLYIVDGIPFDTGGMPSNGASGGTQQTTNALSFINPNDIETVTVLKDASATAIYGSRGSNGVVIITTKRGNKGKDKIEFNMSFGVSSLVKHMDVLSGADYARYMNEQTRNYYKYDGVADVGLPFDGTYNPDGKYYKPLPEDFELGYLNGGTDWQDVIFQTGFTQEYNIGYSGAGEKGYYSVSANYLDQEGTIKNTGYRRIGVRTNLARKVHKWIELGTSTNVSRSVTDFTKTNANDDNGILRGALLFPPDRPIFDENADGGFSRLDWVALNPYIALEGGMDQVTSYSVFSSNFIELALANCLKFRQNVGLNYNYNERNTYYNRYTLEGKDPKNGIGSKGDNYYQSLITESLLTFDKTFNKVHALNIVAGFTAEVANMGSKSITVENFANDYTWMWNLSAGSKIQTPTSGRSRNQLASFLGRVNYGFKDRYLFTASFRTDGSSKFAKKNKWAFFPSAAVAWRASEEPFIKNLNVFSMLKLRASYGETGNQGIGSYQTLSLLSPVYEVLDGTKVPGGVDSYLPNEDLIWETTRQVNAGIDISFLDNKLNFVLDLYYKKTFDLLQNRVLPISTGFSTQMTNSGSVINKGLELSVKAYLISHKNFHWDIDANISFNRNRIEDLETDQYASRLWIDADKVFLQREGCPIGVIYGYVEDGFYDNEAEVRADPQYRDATDSKIYSMIGEVKYKDFDGDGAITEDKDRRIIGNVNPDFTYGITNNFRWKNLSFSFFLQGIQGNDILNGNLQDITMSAPQNITREAYRHRWTADNPTNAKYPKPYSGLSRMMKFSDRYIEDGSYLRLKNVSLGYTFYKPFKHVSSIDLSFNATNLFTITNYSWYDPDVNAFGGDPARRGVDIYSYPSSRTYTFSLKLTF